MGNEKKTHILESLPNVNKYYKQQGSPRGFRTWQWHLPNGTQITFYKRLYGEKFGSHFHKGDDPSKNPELLVLLSGIMTFRFLSSDGERSELVTLDATDGPQCLTIFPMVLHYVEAETDVFYIEYRLNRFDPDHPDTYLEREFYELFPNAASWGQHKNYIVP